MSDVDDCPEEQEDFTSPDDFLAKIMEARRRVAMLRERLLRLDDDLDPVSSVADLLGRTRH